MQISEMIREWAWVVGTFACNIDQQWILSDWDTWEKNPHYVGPTQKHPEDENEEAAQDDRDPFRYKIKQVFELPWHVAWQWQHGEEEIPF